MLIEFKVSNFLSMRDPQTLSLVASSGKDKELESNVCHVKNNADLRLTRAAVIYGANAAGKSNLLSALLFMQFLVQSSATQSQQGGSIPVKSFLFDKTIRYQPSEFEVTFIRDAVRYQYGFVVDKARVREEWLVAYPSGHAQQWFHRIYDSKKASYTWKFSKFFKDGRRLADLTRENVLFLSRSVDLNNEQLKPVFAWFQEDLVFIDLSAGGNGQFNVQGSIERIKTEAGKQKVLTFIQNADKSVTDITMEIEKVEENPKITFPAEMPPAVRDYLAKQLAGGERVKINFDHGVEDATLHLGEESVGTKRAFGFAGSWIDAIENGRILIVDELDNSLHPLFVRFLISLLCDPEINKKGAQLIFSTHDTSLLDNELFRRDQIWFVEKDKHNATQLYPLLDFSPRKHEALAKGYLQGRYGALPYIGEWKF